MAMQTIMLFSGRLKVARARWLSAAAAFASLAVIACGGGGDESSPVVQPTAAALSIPTATATVEPRATETPIATASASTAGAAEAGEVSGLPQPPSGPPPPLDLTQRVVDPTKIVFDTFNGGSVRLPDASPELIEQLRDAIQPIYTPVYESAAGGEWMDDDDLVVGYEAGGEAFAYPVKMLNFHELVNDIIDGVPVLITWCPLCGSGVVYDRRIGKTTYLFGNTSALFENDLVMFDYQTGSFWFQTAAEAIVGPLSGTRLRPLAATTITWGKWKEINPDTRVLARIQPEIIRRPDYTRNPFAGGAYAARLDDLQFPFPTTLDDIDNRLRPSEITISIAFGAAEKAYSLEQLGDAVVNDEFLGRPVVVFSEQRGPIGNGFSRILGDMTLTFRLDGDRILDDQTNSEWDFSGTAISGELEGETLELLTARRAFWFSLAFAVPGIELYEPDSLDQMSLD
ncbi:MAG: DUF3179 domain-containing protein [Chloroflexi bacterium]|nr:DUF3179 domain-containing protein [Chloroflexota bacterium]